MNRNYPSGYTCLTETVIDNEFPSDLPVTVILDDENETELKTNSGYIDGYGEVGIVYENSNGEFLWDEMLWKYKASASNCFRSI